MRKRTSKIISVILLVMLCLSLLPVMAMAAESGLPPSEAVSGTESGSSTESVAESIPVSVVEPASDPAPEQVVTSEPASSETEPAPESSVEPEPESTPGEAVESTPEPVSDPELEPTPAPEAEPQPYPELPTITPQPHRVVAEPLIKIEYRYYDDSQPATVTDLGGYSIVSTHSFYAKALALENNAGLAIPANKFPGLVPVSAETSRFRVWLDGTTDITALASYDAATGTVTLPYECTGHAINIAFYCPASEVVELPVDVSTSFYQNGVFTDTTTDLALASSANTIAIPLAAASAVVIEQNGMPLDESAYSMTDGMLTINAPALGGDISIAAYAPRPRTRAGGQVATKSTTAPSLPPISPRTATPPFA